LNFNELIRDVRIKKGWTMTDISNKLECSQSLISNWEAGKTFPHPKYYDKILKYLGINPKEYEGYNVANEPSVVYNKNTSQDIASTNALENISLAHINMAEAQKNLSESNKILTESLKDMMNKYNEVTMKIIELMETKIK
jgi:transcriptional regulator with XRE-family HTH domain